MSNPAEKLMDSIKWEPVQPPTENPDNLPYPTHGGTLEIVGFKFKCYVLNTGERIIDAESLKEFIGG